MEVRHEKGARRVIVTWDDQHTSTYPIDYLRSWCPCAGCQGHDPVAKYRQEVPDGDGTQQRIAIL